jgi:adsorption protein B
MGFIDSWVAACLTPLAVWVLASGLDDLVVDVAWLWGWLRRRLGRAGHAAWPDRAAVEGAPEKRMALFVPLWREDGVIGRMLEHNLAAIDYRSYDVFIGAYPNDGATLGAVREAERRFKRVHLVVCPNDGPTSKADCLNWIYQGMLLFEEKHQTRFEVVLLHDAEDLVHPGSLRWVNYLADTHDMIQIPVLPLPTPWWRFTHGVYCDEFAEFQSRDMPVRRMLGGFMPSSGVGTGYSRRALERLAAAASGCIFAPDCLTEDYEIGLRLRNLGCRQVFVPIRFFNGNPLATRELFPGRFADALRQRTRWVIGIALQTWQKHGWGRGFPERYWFWRDRKGLVGNPGSFLINLMFLYGLASWAWSRATDGAWGLADAAARPTAAWLFQATLLLLGLRTGIRVGCVARVYGWRLALGAPLRIFWANWLNSCATVSALGRYLGARARRRPLAWLKTEHRYPSRAALMNHKRRLGEVLVSCGRLTEREVETALSSKPPHLRLGEHLVTTGRLSAEDVYEALGRQQNLPFERLEPAGVRGWAPAALPASVARRCRVVAFTIEPGRLYVAGPELPSEDVERELRLATGLEIRYHLITPANLEALSRALA